VRRPDASTQPPEAAPPRPAQTPRSRKGVETRARLLDAAKREFEEAGFLEARISDIAERAGLSHGSFYHYFESKEQIFREVADAQEEMLTAPPADESSPDDRSPDDRSPDDRRVTAYERIERANRRYLERYRGAAAIMGVIEEVSRYDPEVNVARMRSQNHFAARAEASIKQLQDEGIASPDVDPKIASVALGAMVARFAELWLVQDYATFEFEDAVDQLSRLWAHAIGLDELPPPRKRAGRAR
jgi:AcrR family transcriptional regulator